MAKMRNGIIKRGATYSYVIREHDPGTGVSRQRWVGGFATHATAAAARDAARVAARAGELPARSRETLSDYLIGWLTQIDVKPKTLSGYRYHVEHYIQPRLGATPLQDLRPLTLTAYYADLQRSGGRHGSALGWRSIQAIHRTLSSALNSAVRLQLIASNPAERATLPRKPRTTSRSVHDQALRTFDPDQLRSFLAQSATHRLHALFHVAAFTGARRGELLHLRWRDLRVDDKELLIAGSRTGAGKQVVEGSTKGGRARILSLDDGTLEVLRIHRASQLVERLAAGPLWNDEDDFVFRTTTGSPLHLDTPSSLMPKLCAAAGLPRLRFHDLRHTHATLLLSAGIPAHEVADRLGHSDATITLKVYASVLRERSRGLGDAFASVLTAEGAC